MKDLSISKTKKKKDENPKMSAKKLQQQKKKIEGAALIGIDVAKEADLGECYILESASYAIWESIKSWFDAQIETLKREKEHVEGFAAEVAWVTKGDCYVPYFAKKIQSDRDLPLKLNQWNNVVRWEFKHPMPFIRSREFLWQEGHTTHLTKEEAGAQVRQILDWYADVYQELLAVPVVKGQKTENEKFPGADYTTTIEGFIPATGRGIQAATSHCLGQHFSKMFNITNSWGLTTRSIGVMILTHGDNRGLVIPPRVAEIQVVVIPVGVTVKMTPEAKAALHKQVQDIADDLKSVGVRVETDYREGYSPGWKFNDWELKGIPLRIEFGPKDAEKGVVTTSRRDIDNKDEARGEAKVDEVKEAIPKLLEQIQSDMFNRADKAYREHRVQLTDWKGFVPALNNKSVVLVPHCEGEKCEDQVKEFSAKKDDGDNVAEDAKAPAMGLEGIKQGETKCINPECGNFAKAWVLFGRSTKARNRWIWEG
ncbi:prolyl-tRNA synthetase [Zopfia rhizophila CBS 207.26]|uniref:proline--tRNA ligase n=1 Tax=Zopfia rhizophila CBS 207.26 TaxID=1314779 RepID=A0A6A6E8Q8_9PEZI|nr:prolyl-tRNA synthetase [Zopfia rhizophila CBS 207.26]